MLMINDKLPASKIETFYTVANNQQMVEITIFETRSADDMIDIEGRQPITSFNMEFRNAVPYGTPIEVTFTLDNSGLLHIIAVEQMYGSRLDTTFQLSNQMSDEEMRMAASRMHLAKVE